MQHYLLLWNTLWMNGLVETVAAVATTRSLLKNPTIPVFTAVETAIISLIRQQQQHPDHEAVLHHYRNHDPLSQYQ
jgi:hypothetical protein